MAQRILVIEDDEHLRTMLRRMLEKAGYEVVEAADGAAGVTRFRAEPTDLILTDILMPGQEGLETIMQLRREERRVPIIAMSGGGRVGPQDYLAAADKLGAYKTLVKPFSSEELLRTLREALDSTAT